MIAYLLGRIYGWERPRPDIDTRLARSIAVQVAAGLALDAHRDRGIGASERADRRERERARNCLMVAGAMVAAATRDRAARETLELAGAMHRGEVDVRVRRL